MKPSVYRVVFSLLAPLILAGLVSGCASTKSSEDPMQSRAAAIGVWTYRVEGPAALTRGKFRITVEENQLRAHLQDERRGRMKAQVTLNGSRMELALHGLRISGQINDESFTGRLYRDVWDVSTSPQRRRSFQSRSTTFIARRTSSGSVIDLGTPLGCPSILRESGNECG